MEVQKRDYLLLHAPWEHVFAPSPEAAVKRARSRQRWLPQQLLNIIPTSGRQNVGPRPHQALKNVQGDVVVCRKDDLAATRERLQHWARRKRSLGHGGCKGSMGSEEGERGIMCGPSILKVY
jgi:hypothetical protein